MSKIFLLHTLTKKYPWNFLTSLSLYIFTTWKCIAYNFFCRDGIYFDKILDVVGNVILYNKRTTVLARWSYICLYTNALSIPDTIYCNIFQNLIKYLVWVCIQCSKSKINSMRHIKNHRYHIHVVYTTRFCCNLGLVSVFALSNECITVAESIFAWSNECITVSVIVFDYQVNVLQYL